MSRLRPLRPSHYSLSYWYTADGSVDLNLPDWLDVASDFDNRLPRGWGSDLSNSQYILWMMGKWMWYLFLISAAVLTSVQPPNPFLMLTSGGLAVGLSGMLVTWALPIIQACGRFNGLAGALKAMRALHQLRHYYRGIRAVHRSYRDNQPFLDWRRNVQIALDKIPNQRPQTVASSG